VAHTGRDLTDLVAARRRVEQAFANRPYPRDKRIADADPRYEDYEGHAVAAFHRGKRWQAITLRHLLDEYAGDPTACLAFMTPEGWRYYLPAYLLMALEGNEAGAITDAVIGALTHPRARKAAFTRVAGDLGLEPETVLTQQTERFDQRMSGLTAAELSAARIVLVQLAARADADNARFSVALPNAAREALESWPGHLSPEAT
jgi:hypothetical protein